MRASPLVPCVGDGTNAIGKHNERVDGMGYPSGLAGEEISLGARIVCVADCYETMTAFRSYRSPLTPAEARRELTRNAGSQFDPGVVRAFMSVSLGRVRRALGLVGLGWLPLLPGGIARVIQAVAPATATIGAIGGAIAIGLPVVPLSPAN